MRPQPRHEDRDAGDGHHEQAEHQEPDVPGPEALGRLWGDLRENPEEAHQSEENFGRHSSQSFNGLDRPADEVRLFLALREAASQRLFAHVPWLRQQLQDAVHAYARGITIDRQVLSRLSGEFAQTAARLEAEIQQLAGSMQRNPARISVDPGISSPTTISHAYYVVPAVQSRTQLVHTLLQALKGGERSMIFCDQKYKVRRLAAKKPDPVYPGAFACRSEEPGLENDRIHRRLQ